MEGHEQNTSPYYFQIQLRVHSHNVNCDVASKQKTGIVDSKVYWEVILVSSNQNKSELVFYEVSIFLSTILLEIIK